MSNDNEKLQKKKKKFTFRTFSKLGLHYGHRAKEWNPKMAPYIRSDLRGFHILDILQSFYLLRLAGNIVEKKAAKGKSILFVGTEKIAKPVISAEAKRSRTFYITNKWLGGLLTNWSTVKKRVKKYRELEALLKKPEFQTYPKKQRSLLKKKLRKLTKLFRGIKKLPSLPSLVIFSSQGKNRLAIQECRKLGIHAICIVDTNCDPDLLPYSIPANDDSLVSIAFIFHYLANRAIAGHKKRFQVRSSEVSKKVSLTY